MARRTSRASQAAQSAPATRPFANPERGEHLLELGGVSYKLRPSYSAIVEMERSTGLSLMELTTKADRQALQLHHAAAVMTALIKAGATDAITKMVSEERIGELIYEQGLVSVVLRLGLCLVDAVSGGRTAEGNAKAAVA